MKPALPYLFAGLYLLARDGGTAPLAVWALANVLAALTWSLDSALGHIADRIVTHPAVARVTRWAAWTLWAWIPCAFALDAYWRAGEELSLLTPTAALSIVFGIVGVRWAATRLGWWSASSDGTSIVVGLPAWLMFAWLTERSGTLNSVRPGRELEHLALFLASWGLTLLASVVEGHTRARGGNRRPADRWLGALCLLIGGALLEADRYALVDQYHELHLWMTIQGFILLRLGIEGLVPIPSGLRWHVRWGGPGVLLGLGLLGGFHLPTYAHPQIRGVLERSALGRSVLHLIPPDRPVRAPVARGTPLPPELDYPRFLDEEPPLVRPNILLVTVDALRHDVYPHTPALEAFAAKSLRFEHAYAPGSRTTISIGALMSGRYSANIDWELWVWGGGMLIPATELTDEQARKWDRKFLHATIPRIPAGNMLAERFKARGYRTVAVPFASDKPYFRRGLPFDRGFDTFVDLTKSGWRPPTSLLVAERVIEELGKLEPLEQPWFFWTHFYDPHESAGDPSEYAKLVAAFDRGFARLIAYLVSKGQLTKTVVALVSDHGEALGEHGHRTHATSLFDEEARVPLVLWVPGIDPARIESPVAAIDLTATLGVLAGADVERIDGTNLLPLVRRVPSALRDRPIFSELHCYYSNRPRLTADMKSVRLGPWKFIYNRGRGTVALYDLVRDPDEEHNRVADEPAVAERLRHILDAFLATTESEHPLPGGPTR